MRPLAIFAAGALAGALLALLLTSPTQSRQASAPRPSVAVIPPAGWGLGEAEPRRTPAAPYPGVVVMTPQPATGTQPAPEGTPATAIPSPGHTPKPTTRPAQARSGVASWVAASYGADYLAARLPRGTRLRICGPVGCVTRTVNDYGPSRRVHPDRIVDLSRHDFAIVCGSPSMGVCRVTVERLR